MIYAVVRVDRHCIWYYGWSSQSFTTSKQLFLFSCNEANCFRLKCFALVVVLVTVGSCKVGFQEYLQSLQYVIVHSVQVHIYWKKGADYKAESHTCAFKNILYFQVPTMRTNESISPCIILDIANSTLISPPERYASRQHFKYQTRIFFIEFSEFSCR